MLDYKSIITRRYALGSSGRELAREFHASKSGINGFLRAFEACKELSYPLPEGITNEGIHELVYGHRPGENTRSSGYEEPDFEAVYRHMTERKNMTLVYQWGRYRKECESKGLKAYQYRQFCELFGRWCSENHETLHLLATPGQRMEVDFAGRTFRLADRWTGETRPVVVFVAVLPYSQYVYAEGMESTKEPQWIEANNHALEYFGGVPPVVVCDNCKQAVVANRDWIEPELNEDYAAWAEHNRTAILPAKVRKPRYKSSVENAVGILEKGLFHDLGETPYFSLEQFNRALWAGLGKLNSAPFQRKPGSRKSMWEEERRELLPLPSVHYQYTERRTAKVSSDSHIRFDNSYYSVDRAYLHKSVQVAATATRVDILSEQGKLIASWPRATARGQWLTNPDHVPKGLRQVSEWNADSFIARAKAVGPACADVIRLVLSSRRQEVQTYRQCVGILGFARRYGSGVLEDCCRTALDSGHPSYSFVKNLVGASGTGKARSDGAEGAYVRSPQASDLGRLLDRSSRLAKEARHEQE